MDTTQLINLFKRKTSLKKYRRIFGFVCFFGSLKKRDLDFFAIPNKNTKKGHFLKILILFFEEIKNELWKNNVSLLITPHSTFEEEIKYINTKKIRKQINVHVSSFPDIHPIPIKSLLPTLRKTNLILMGNNNAINQMKKTKLDYYYDYLFISNCLMSNYPKKLEKEKIFHKVNYIYKHLTGKKKKLKGTTKKVFFDCCDFLDQRI